MSDLEMNLGVLTGYLLELAGGHQKAADLITGANRHTDEISSNVESSHGQVCWATINALSGGEPRKAAGETLVRVAGEFSEKLGRAANNYNNADYRAGRTIGEAGTACQA
ncbi:ESX-1 secretion-associated protein [Mycolicibacterium houstonense]|uniref:ESX-1 secretion-associated protein n=1 Tax=Mycolicibacterium houstonense TaxID=146021 RepID=UPI003F97F2D8